MTGTLQPAAFVEVAFVACAYCGHAFAESFNRPQDVREITDIKTRRDQTRDGAD